MDFKLFLQSLPPEKQRFLRDQVVVFAAMEVAYLSAVVILWEKITLIVPPTAFWVVVVLVSGAITLQWYLTVEHLMREHFSKD